jgi:hypothetical protein
MKLRGEDSGRYGLEGKTPVLRLRMLGIADRALRLMFQTYARNRLSLNVMMIGL